MILFVDDEQSYVENICSELGFLGAKVEFCKNVDVALHVLETTDQLIRAIVCDVMMPHGNAFSAADTAENRRTGLLFLKRIRDMGITLHVILLTNDERPHVKEFAENYPPCTVIQKREYQSFEVAERINGLLSDGTK